MDRFLIDAPAEQFRPFPSRVVYENEEILEIDELPPELAESARDYLAMRIESHRKTAEEAADRDLNDNPDRRRMLLYPPSDPGTRFTLRSPEAARERLLSFRDGFFRRFIEEAELEHLEAAILGSAALTATVEGLSFTPADIDLYVKSIDRTQIEKIDRIARKIASDDQRVIVVRRPLTIQWWLLDSDDRVVEEIQLNSLRADYWIEICEDYHSDPVCVCYEIETRNFYYHADRWPNFLRTPEDRPFWFSNLFSISSVFALIHAAHKYDGRGFPALCLLRHDDGRVTVADTDHLPNLVDGCPEATHRLIAFNWRSNVLVSSTIEPLLFDDPPASVLQLAKLAEDREGYYYAPARLNRRRALLSDEEKRANGMLFIEIDGDHEVEFEQLIRHTSHSRFPTSPVTQIRYHRLKLKS